MRRNALYPLIQTHIIKITDSLLTVQNNTLEYRINVPARLLGRPQKFQCGTLIPAGTRTPGTRTLGGLSPLKAKKVRAFGENQMTLEKSTTEK